MLDRRPPDLPAVGARPAPDRGVDQEVHVAAPDAVDDVRGALADLVQPLHRHAHLADRLRGAARREHAEAEVVHAGGELGGGRLVGVADADEDARPPRAAPRPPPAWALPKAVGKSRAMPITSPVDFISGPSSASEPWKRWNGSTTSLTLTWPPLGSRGRSWSASRSPRISRQATFASGTPIAFETNGTVRDARGFASIT